MNKYHIGKCRWSGLWIVSLNGQELCAHRQWAEAVKCAWIDVAYDKESAGSPQGWPALL